MTTRPNNGLLPIKESLIALLFIAAACNKPSQSLPPQPVSQPVKLERPAQPAKNIVLMIGDGMGLSQISAGMIRNNNTLFLEQFPVIGLHKAYSSDNLITDSAAGATAFASGIKTYNGAIGVTADQNPAPTILEQAEARGMATGMVVTSTVVHATPAAFIAHVKDRNMYENIALGFLQTEIDLVIGGGSKYFNRRSDQRNLYGLLQEKGYYVSDFSIEPLTDIALDFTKNLVYFTSESDPPTVQQGRDYLIPASRLACNFLSRRSDKGFFLMIEGAQIDWAGHANNTSYMVNEMIEFDKAIGEVLKYAKEDGNTLIIVTGDHETGGFSINQGTTKDSIIAGYTTDYHTGTLIPVFAYGPGASLFSGIYENNSIYDRMCAAMGW
ncbi:MAG: alkaline phosphatase [Saprospiraceae bacterium]|nr:alkaline phosphatase [Saprospiraceae bacterium]